MSAAMSEWKLQTHTGSGPKYLALVGALEDRISGGHLREGDRLPPQRDLARMFGVTIATVTRAIAEASRRGLVVARPGSGTYVKDRSTLPGAAPEIVDLSINTLPSDLVAGLLDAALAEVAARKISHDAFGYSSYGSNSRHRATGAEWVSRFGLDVGVESVLPTHGVHQGLMAAFGALAKPGDSVICEPFTYTGIKRIAEYRGLKLIGADMDDEGLLPDSVGRELRNSGAKIVIVTTVAQNPTTASLSMERRRALAEVCRKADAIILEDAINVPLAGDQLHPIAHYAPERTLYLTSFSKCVTPGFRLGYAVVPPQVFPIFHDALISTQWIGPLFYAELADILLAGSQMDKCLDLHRREAKARVTLTTSLLDCVKPVTFPGYHVWGLAPAGWQADEFCTEALRQGVRISPASHFAVSPTPSIQAFRISLGGCETREQLQSGLERLARILQHKHAVSGTVV
jgi:DNA-binding transcriptional MocR family regulator